MKKTILFSLLLVLALGLFSCNGQEKEKSTSQEPLEHDESYAYYGVEFMYGGLQYKIINHNSVLLVQNDSHRSFSGDLVIPSTVTYNDVIYDVVEVESYAFSGCESLTSVSVPSHTTIRYKAFPDHTEVVRK